MCMIYKKNIDLYLYTLSVIFNWVIIIIIFKYEVSA